MDLKVEIMRHGIEVPPGLNLRQAMWRKMTTLPAMDFSSSARQAESEAYETGWYDMRITAKDNAGNRNIQEFGMCLISRVKQESGRLIRAMR